MAPVPPTDERLNTLIGARLASIGIRAKLLLIQRVLDDLFAQCDVVVQDGPVLFDVIGLPELAFTIGFTAADDVAELTQ